MGVFSMPSLGADMEAGTLVEWLVAPGDQVARGDSVAVVETQKGAIEIECFEAGTVQELLADLDAELPVGAPLALILAEGESAPAIETAAPPQPAPEPAPAGVAEARTPTAPPPPAAMPKGTVMASPAARVRAAELGLDLGTIRGTGPGGVIVLGDVDAPGVQPASKPAATPAPKGTPAEEMRKAISAAMTRSKQTIPHFSVSETVDLQPATDFLARANAGRPPAERLLMGALFTRAVVGAATKVTVLNGHYTEAGFQPATQVNPGIAVALRGGGLVAPALMDAAALSLDQVMAGMRDLVTRARAGRLRGQEMTAGTITISSLGESGAEAMTGVIFPPQVALVGIGAPKLRPWVVADDIVPRQTVTITLAADHRVADGRQAARFLDEIATLLQQPEAL